MQRFNVIYVDDTPDTDLSRYLDGLESVYENEEYKFSHYDIIFKPGDDYNTLITSEKIQSANILVIDSMLFANSTATKGKFTGEEFKFVLQKFYPYIEVILISQNQLAEGMDVLHKYVLGSTESGAEYYAHKMRPLIDSAIHAILQYRMLANQMNANQSWESLLKEKVLGTLQGTQTYDSLTKNDIDVLISAFKEIKGILNG